MNRPVTGAEFGRMLATFSSSAFRFETRASYALGYERADFEAFLAGHPRPPAEVEWWREWLEQIRQQASDGKTIARVRILHHPPSDYQRWEQWCDPWHADAGERIRYLPLSRAAALSLPLDHDWWLLDETHLIVTRFSPSGEIASKTLITSPEIITSYLTWRDLAVRNATTAEAISAA
jgi:hypothetical protein